MIHFIAYPGIIHTHMGVLFSKSGALNYTYIIVFCGFYVAVLKLRDIFLKFKIKLEEER